MTRLASDVLLSILLMATVFLCGCGLTVNTLPLQIAPNSVAFGVVSVGTTQTTTVSLLNPGMKAESVSGMSIGDAAFTVSSGASSVPAGGTATFQLTFAPTTAKSYSSQLTVMSDGGQLNVPLSGTGQQSAGQSPPPATAALQVSTTAIEFGSVTVGTQTQQSLMLTSNGSAPLEINALTAGGVFSVQAPSLPLTLQPGQTLNLPVQFAPTATGPTTGQLVIASNAAAAPSVTVSLAGSGGAASPTPPPTPPPAQGTPSLTLSSTSIDFGSVPVGSQTPSSVTLSSTGTVAVVLQALTVTGAGFSSGQLALPLTLAPGQQVSLPLTFAPTTSGAVQGQVTLMDNATGSASTIALSGTGVAAASPSLSISPGSVNFGDVTVGSNAFQIITLVANGTVPVTVNSVAVAGASFSTGVQGLPRVLQPSQQLSVQVKFDPAATGAANGTITVTSDATNPSTVVPVTGNGVAPAAPSLAGSASSLSFGQVTVGAEATKMMTVTSTGTAPATITGGSLSGAGYTATYAGVPVQNLSAPITLQPGQQVGFNVAFDPTNVGASSGQLSLSTDTGSPVNVSLTGTGTAQTSPALTISAPSLDFGDVQVNQQTVLQLTLTSSGTAPVTISSSTIAGQDFEISSVAYPAGITGWPATLSPGQQVTLSISFDPSTVGAATGSLAVNSDASGGTGNVALTGNGDAAPAPKLSLSTTSLSFGSTPIGSRASRTFTMSSSGGAPLVISAVALTGTEFTDGNPSLPVTLQPGQQLTLTVTFDPTTVGSDAETLTITSNDATSPATVSLGGVGASTASPVLTVTPGSVDFGSVPINTTATEPVTLTSTGSAPVTVSAATLTGVEFSDTGASFPVTLNPNQSVTLQVKFDPTAAGAATGRLAVTSNSTGGATTNIPLTGTGTLAAVPQLAVSAASLAFGDVTVGSSATLPLTLTSTGSAPVTVSAAAMSGAGFTVAGSTFPVTLNPNQSVVLQVRFSPVAAGAAAGQLTINSDSWTNGSPVVQLTGTGTVAAVPQLTLSSAVLSFGNVTVNSTATLPLTLTSTGTGPVTISSATLSGASFSDSGAPFPVTLNPNQSVTLQVSFDPGTAASAAGQLTVSSNSSTNATAVVQLSGTGTAAPTPQLTVSAASLTFGSVTVNSTATLPLRLTSSGTAPVTVSAATLSGASFSDSGATFPVTLNPNQSVTLQVQFDPSTAGAATGQLTIVSDSSSGANTVVQLNGTGAVPAAPQLTVSTAALTFGNVTVNTSATLPLTLTSTGTAPVTVNAATLSGAGFSDSGAGFPVTLNPNQSVTLQVQFDPSTAGAASGQLMINSNSTTGGTVVVQLSGTGTAPTSLQLTVSTGTLAFGNVTVNTNATLPLTLTSTGTAPVTVNAATLSGAGFSDSGAAFPVTLNPNQSLTLQVQFDPSTAGAAAGQLVINSNSKTGGMMIVQLSGTGTAATSPQLLVGSTSLAFGNVPVGSTSTLTLTLSSTGTAPVTVSAATLSGAGFSDSGATFPVTLNPNQSVTLQVQFDPTAAGAAAGQLTINSNSTTGATVMVQISGTGTAVQHEIDLSWNAPASSPDPVAGYNVYRSTNGGALTKLSSTAETQLDYVDNAVQSGSTYAYVVKSVDAGGVESVASNQISLPVP